MAIVSQGEMELTDAAGLPAGAVPPYPERRQRPLRVYMMDMWSFIPYYMGRLCAALASESVDVTLGSVRYHLDREYFHKTGLTSDPRLFDSGGRFKNNSLRRLIKTCEYLANLFLLALRFRTSKPDVLHVQYMPFLEHRLGFELWFLRWVRDLRIPIVYTAHNVTKQNNPEEGRELYRRIYHTADALICHGEEARAELVRDFGVGEQKIWVIPHGPLFEDRPSFSSREARLALGLPVEEPLVLFQGVISEYKGVPFLLDAWKRFKQLGGKGSLLIAGTGNSRIILEIQKRVLSEPLRNVELWLRFIPVEQLPLLYEAADILVYPYKAGTTSGALLTGLQYGKAIIATKLPFFCEHLENGETAVLIDYEDREALASSLLDLSRRPEERLRLGTALQRQESQGTTWDEIAKQTLECYESVIKPFGPRVA